MEMEAWLLLVSRRGKRVPELGVDGIWGERGGARGAGGRWQASTFVISESVFGAGRSG